MGKIVKIIEESDYELLRNCIEQEPCKTCPQKAYSCMGCQAHKKWREKHEKYKEAGIAEVLTFVQEVKKLQEVIRDACYNLARERDKIVEEGYDLTRIFDDNEFVDSLNELEKRVDFGFGFNRKCNSGETTTEAVYSDVARVVTKPVGEERGGNTGLTEIHGFDKGNQPGFDDRDNAPW